MADTQPFLDPAGRYAFSHNGDLRDYRSWRARYRTEGRIHGRADTEVGARWLEDAWSTDEPVAHLLGALHDTFAGQANMAVLAADGTPYHYAGNGENPVFGSGGSGWPRPGSTRWTVRSSGSSPQRRSTVG